MADEGFKSRGDAHEGRAAYDELRRFEAQALACRRAGEWAAQRLALPADEAATLADNAAAYATRKDGWNALATMLAERMGEATTERQVRHAMDDLLAAAAQEVASRPRAPKA